MIEALARLLAEVFGVVLVQGLGLLLLRFVLRRRDPSEGACTVAGLCGWLGIAIVVAIGWGR